MSYDDFLERVVNDGVATTMEEYADDDELSEEGLIEHEFRRQGALRGFESCRGRTPEGLAALLSGATSARQLAEDQQAEDYWCWRCSEEETTLVCEVVSALLQQQGKEVILSPTPRGLARCADLLRADQKSGAFQSIHPSAHGRDLNHDPGRQHE